MLSSRHVRWGGLFLSSPPLSPQCSHWVPICCWLNSEWAFSQGIESGSSRKLSAWEAYALSTMLPRSCCYTYIILNMEAILLCKFIPFCLFPRYLNAVQTTCPHILRYLTTAVITSEKRRQLLKDLVKVIQQESYTYRDPITEFIECLYVNIDFDGAQKKLRECEQVCLSWFA